MPADRLARLTLLPELKLTGVYKTGPFHGRLEAEKVSPFEVCPKCATASHVIYDRRRITVRDSPLRDKHIRLVILKRRFKCKSCGAVFTEPVSGISKGRRYTERYRRSLLWACETFVDLKSVRKNLGCSYGFIYKALYEQLELQRRMKTNYPWPKTIGIDEHSFGRNKEKGFQEFVSFIIDHKNKKAFEVVKGRTSEDLREALSHIQGRENVRFVTMDMSETYRRFVRGFFPNAQIIADKFHVSRLLNQAINRRRKEITGDKRANPIRRLLLRNRFKLKYSVRLIIDEWLRQYPDLSEIYWFKEALHKFYRTRGYNKAARALTKLTDEMGYSNIIEIQATRKTLLSWRKEIILYFATGLTNARVEGFNNVAKVIKRRAYGYRSFKNYRLRLLNACA